MTLTRPMGIDAAFPNASDYRKNLGTIYPRKGIFPDPVTTAASGIAYAGTGWGVSARAFTAAAKRGDATYATGYGTALVTNDSVVTNAWTISPAPSSGSRIDILCVLARDVTQGESASGAPMDGPGGVTRSGYAEFVVITGVPGTPGVRPSVASGYVEIAQITTPAGAASAAGSTIVQTYDFAHAIGGPVYYRSIAAMNADTFAYPAGTEAYTIAEDRRFFRESGSATWRPRERIATYSILSNGVPDSTVISSAATMAITTETTDSSFITGSTGTALTLKRGQYIVSMTFFAGAAMTGRSFAEVRKGSATGTILGRDYGANGEDTITVTSPVYVEANGITLYLQFLKATGGTSDVTGRIVVAKMS